MAAIREVDLGRVINSQVDVSLPWGNLLDQIVEAARKAIGDDMWRWFRENQDVAVLKLNKWIFSWTLRVKDTRFLFELLFGPEVF